MLKSQVKITLPTEIFRNYQELLSDCWNFSGIREESVLFSKTATMGSPQQKVNIALQIAYIHNRLRLSLQADDPRRSRKIIRFICREGFQMKSCVGAAWLCGSISLFAYKSAVYECAATELCESITESPHNWWLLFAWRMPRRLASIESLNWSILRSLLKVLN